MRPKPLYYRGFGERLNRLLAEVGYSQKELAQALGVKQGTVSSWIAGRKCPLPETARKISEALGVPWDRLRGEIEGSGPATKHATSWKCNFCGRVLAPHIMFCPFCSPPLPGKLDNPGALG